MTRHLGFHHNTCLCAATQDPIPRHRNLCPRNGHLGTLLAIGVAFALAIVLVVVGASTQICFRICTRNQQCACTCAHTHTHHKCIRSRLHDYTRTLRHEKDFRKHHDYALTPGFKPGHGYICTKHTHSHMSLKHIRDNLRTGNYMSVHTSTYQEVCIFTGCSSWKVDVSCSPVDCSPYANQFSSSSLFTHGCLFVSVGSRQLLTYNLVVALCQKKRRSHVYRIV